MIALAAFCAAAAQLANKHTECDGWARAGECNGNPQFMNKECATSCAEVVVEPGAEMEQCPGWASQGECTRNPKFMMTTCPRNCAEQRAKVVDGLLDTSPSCIDSANAAVSTCVDMHAVPQPCCSRAVAGPQPGRLYGLRLAAFCVPDAPEAQGHSPSRATRRLGLSYRAARLGATGLRRPGDGEALPGELRLLRVLRGGRRPGRVSARAPLPRAQGRKERLC